MNDYDFTKIPFDRIVKLGQISMLDSDLFTVSWLLGRYCNFKCSYCWEHGRSDKVDHRPTDLCLRTIDSIKLQANLNGFNSFHFSLSGGEPTLHPGYFDILDKLAKDKPYTNYTSIHMTTNLSKDMKWFEKYVKYAQQFDRASITASYHREYMRDKTLFASKLLFLEEAGVHTTINMVMVPEIFYDLWNVALYFKNKGLNVTLKPQSDPHANHVVSGYSDIQLEILHNEMKQEIDNIATMQVRMIDDEGKVWYMDQAERFNAFNFNCFKGWICSSGFRSIIIREPCGSIKRSYSCIDEPLGNIRTGFNLFCEPQVCISPSCVSSADSKIPKWKE